MKQGVAACNQNLNIRDCPAPTRSALWLTSAFPRGEVAALGSSSPMDRMPTLRQVCVSADVAKGLMNWRISNSASNFQAVFATYSLWHSDCLFKYRILCNEWRGGSESWGRLRQ